MASMQFSGLGVISWLSRNYTHADAALKDLLDNAIDAASKVDGGGDVCVDILPTGTARRRAGSDSEEDEAEEAEGSEAESIDGFSLEACAELPITARRAADTADATASVARCSALNAPALVLSNSAAHIMPMSHIMTFAKSTKGGDPTTIGENGVGLIQASFRLAACTLVLTRGAAEHGPVEAMEGEEQGLQPGRFSLGMFACALQTEHTFVAPYLSFDVPAAAFPAAASPEAAAPVPSEDEFRAALRALPSTKARLLAQLEAQLPPHVSLTAQLVSLSQFGGGAFAIVLGGLVDDAGGAAGLLAQVHQDARRMYLVPSNRVRWRVGGRALAACGWGATLVELARCTLEHCGKEVGVYVGFDPRLPNEQPGSMFLAGTGGRTKKRADAANLLPTCKMWLYSRGRLVEERPNARAALGLNHSGTRFMQGLTVLVDDAHGVLTLSPTKERVNAVPDAALARFFGAIGDAVRAYYNYRCKQSGLWTDNNSPITSTLHDVIRAFEPAVRGAEHRAAQAVEGVGGDGKAVTKCSEAKRGGKATSSSPSSEAAAAEEPLPDCQLAELDLTTFALTHRSGLQHPYILHSAVKEGAHTRLRMRRVQKASAASSSSGGAGAGATTTPSGSAVSASASVSDFAAISGNKQPTRFERQAAALAASGGKRKRVPVLERSSVEDEDEASNKQPTRFERQAAALAASGGKRKRVPVLERSNVEDEEGEDEASKATTANAAAKAKAKAKAKVAAAQYLPCTAAAQSPFQLAKKALVAVYFRMESEVFPPNWGPTGKALQKQMSSATHTQQLVACFLTMEEALLPGATFALWREDAHALELRDSLGLPGCTRTEWLQDMCALARGGAEAKGSAKAKVTKRGSTKSAASKQQHKQGEQPQKRSLLALVHDFEHYCTPGTLLRGVLDEAVSSAVVQQVMRKRAGARATTPQKTCKKQALAVVKPAQTLSAVADPTAALQREAVQLRSSMAAMQKEIAALKRQLRKKACSSKPK